MPFKTFGKFKSQKEQTRRQSNPNPQLPLPFSLRCHIDQSCFVCFSCGGRYTFQRGISISISWDWDNQNVFLPNIPKIFKTHTNALISFNCFKQYSGYFSYNNNIHWEIDDHHQAFCFSHHINNKYRLAVWLCYIHFANKFLIRLKKSWEKKI